MGNEFWWGVGGFVLGVFVGPVFMNTLGVATGFTLERLYQQGKI